MKSSFNDPFLLLCDSFWHKSSPDCLANFSSDPLPEQEHKFKPEPGPDEPNPQSEQRRRSSSSSPSPTGAADPRLSVYDAWLASRVPSHQNGGYITAGAQRPLTRANLRLVQRIAELCIPQMLQLFWSRHPYRAFIMVALSFVRGTFPVFKGYTHALIINEASTFPDRLVLGSTPSPFLQIQSLFSSGHYTWTYLIRLLGAEFLRLAAEKSLDSFA